MISDLEFEVSCFVRNFCEKHNTKNIVITNCWSDGILCDGVVLSHVTENGAIFEEAYTNCYSFGEILQARRIANETLEELQYLE